MIATAVLVKVQTLNPPNITWVFYVRLSKLVLKMKDSMSFTPAKNLCNDCIEMKKTSS